MQVLESNPFDQVPRKEEHSINEEEWLTNQSMYEQPEDLGSITEELQLHRKPNIIQKAWTWFTGLWHLKESFKRSTIKRTRKNISHANKL